jgi:hypothetical protein
MRPLCLRQKLGCGQRHEPLTRRFGGVAKLDAHPNRVRPLLVAQLDVRAARFAAHGEPCVGMLELQRHELELQVLAERPLVQAGAIGE